MLESPPSASASGGVRERLFRIAVDRFRGQGYDGVSVSEITREAGVAKGTFFNHFPSKEHVLAEAFHRVVNEVAGEVGAMGASGTAAILAFVDTLGRRLGGDRPLAEALVPRLASLPPLRPDEVREEDRIRSWLEERLDETLPVAVPLEEVKSETLAFLLTATLRATLEEWGRPDGPVHPLEGVLADRALFLLRSAGLPAEPTTP